MSIHRQAAKGFSAGAAAYAGGRPGYPPEAVDWLREDVGLGPGATALDCGAGTGKFVPRLQEAGARVVALEPVAEMRAELARAHPDVEALAGTAERIPLPDGSLDAVVCAQSFHWFATAAALAEFRRVLRPGGRLGLIWNGRDTGVPWMAELAGLIEARQVDEPRYLSGEWRGLFPAEGFAAVGERTARHRHVGDPEQVLVRRTLSVSFVAALPEAERAAVEREVRALIARTPGLAGRADVAVPYETLMAAFRKTG